MQPRRVGVAIVGGGLMGREIATALQRWPALIDHPAKPELVAVCDINPQAMEWFEQIPTVTATVTDYRQLLQNPDVDVIYVAVRHDLHAEIYCDIIRSGKDLLAEKPFGIDQDAADAIMAAIEESPRSFVRCSSEMPYFPGAQAAIRYVQSGALGQIIEARCSFLHASDLDREKPINWKRQAEFCGEAGVMNDLGMHTWHVPLRLGWKPDSVYAVLQNIVTERPGFAGATASCDTWDNAVIHSSVTLDDYSFPLTTETKRIAPGEKNTWEFHAIGMDGGVRYSTKKPKTLDVFRVENIPGLGREQTWQSVDIGSQSFWPTVTGANFESGFSDAILQMWAAYLAERNDALADGFGTARPDEAAQTHAIFAAAVESHLEGHRVSLSS